MRDGFVLRSLCIILMSHVARHVCRHTSVDTILVSLKAYVRWLHGGAAAHALAFLATDNVTLPESIHALARPELTVVSMPAYGMSNAVIEAANGTMLVRPVLSRACVYSHSATRFSTMLLMQELFLGRLQPDFAHTAYDVTVSVIQVRVVVAFAPVMCHDRSRRCGPHCRISTA